MARGRAPKLKIKGAELDKRIRAVEQSGFNAAKISSFILGKSKTYYTTAIKSNTMSENALGRVCEYYDFEKDDFVVTDEEEKQIVQEKADTQNYENIILLLTSIDRTLKEILAQTKTTNANVDAVKSAVAGVTKLEKDILETVTPKQHKIAV